MNNQVDFYKKINDENHLIFFKYFYIGPELLRLGYKEKTEAFKSMKNVMIEEWKKMKGFVGINVD